MGKSKFVFKPSNIKEIYRIYVEWLMQSKGVESVFYMMTPRDSEPKKELHFTVKAVELKCGFLGFRCSELGMKASYEGRDITVKVRNPVWLIDDGMTYYVRTLVFGGPDIVVE